MLERVRRSFISVPLCFPEIVYMTVYARREKRFARAAYFTLPRQISPVVISTARRFIKNFNFIRCECHFAEPTNYFPIITDRFLFRAANLPHKIRSSRGGSAAAAALLRRIKMGSANICALGAQVGGW